LLSARSQDKLGSDYTTLPPYDYSPGAASSGKSGKGGSMGKSMGMSASSSMGKHGKGGKKGPMGKGGSSPMGMSSSSSLGKSGLSSSMGKSKSGSMGTSMSMGMSSSSVAVVNPSYPSSEPTKVCVVTSDNNVDYPGNDIGFQQVADCTECIALCEARPDCNAFTFVNENAQNPSTTINK
jgi:hypothetical protein